MKQLAISGSGSNSQVFSCMAGLVSMTQRDLAAKINQTPTVLADSSAGLMCTCAGKALASRMRLAGRSSIGGRDEPRVEMSDEPLDIVFVSQMHRVETPHRTFSSGERAAHSHHPWWTGGAVQSMERTA
jgi:hypothetical protein